MQRTEQIHQKKKVSLEPEQTPELLTVYRLFLELILVMLFYLLIGIKTFLLTHPSTCISILGALPIGVYRFFDSVLNDSSLLGFLGCGNAHYLYHSGCIKGSQDNLFDCYF